jgi:hypothetical protein
MSHRFDLSHSTALNTEPLAAVIYTGARKPETLECVSGFFIFPSQEPYLVNRSPSCCEPG